MAMIIDLNTDELQSAVQIARRANEVLTDVAHLLNSVVIHNDWQCPERYEINNNTSRNRTQSLTLQSDAENLYNNINHASQQFLAVEQEIARSFETVDSPIASFLSQTPMMVNKDPVFQNNSAWGVANDILQSAKGDNPSFGGVKQNSNVVSFDIISDALQEK